MVSYTAADMFLDNCFISFKIQTVSDNYSVIKVQ